MGHLGFLGSFSKLSMYSHWGWGFFLSRPGLEPVIVEQKL
jgi:hypothetical protein